MPTPQPGPALEALAPLIGEWRVEVPQFSGASGRTTFAWLDGGAFLRARSQAPAPAPSSTMIIGRDDASEPYTVLYHDARGVSRVYRMGFTGGLWTMVRAAPGFHQRFSGTLGTGDSINAAWERSADGAVWEHDFDMVYTRLA